jgi:hypothetical protein
MKKILATTLMSTLIFIAGYLFGGHQQKTSANTITQSALMNSTRHTSDSRQQEHCQETNTDTRQSISFINNQTIDKKEATKQTEATDASTTQNQTNNSDEDIISLLNRLMSTYSSSDDVEEKLDRHREELLAALTSSSDNLLLITDYILNFESTRLEFNYALSLVKDLPKELSEQVLSELIFYVNGQHDYLHQSQFLSFISAQPNQINNEETFSSLIDIATYQAASDENRNRALDFIEPFQIDRSTKLQIVDNLYESFIANDTDRNDRDQLFNNILKFATAEQREEIANQYLYSDEESSLRYLIISAINAGDVNRTETLKENLFNIALDEKDTLQEAAKQSLISHFDLSNEEYQYLGD